MIKLGHFTDEVNHLLTKEAIRHYQFSGRILGYNVDARALQECIDGNGVTKYEAVTVGIGLSVVIKVNVKPLGKIQITCILHLYQ